MPQPLRNFSHQAKPKKAASGAHPKRQSPSRFCVQAIAELQPQKSRNVAFGTPKNNEMKSCPSHCETFVSKPCETATTNNAEMLPTKRIRSTANPSRFRAQTMRIHRQKKTAETSPTEPVKNKEQRLPPARKNFAQGKPWKSASHQAKPKQKVLGPAETCLTLLSEALQKQAPKPRTNATRHHQVAGSVRTHLAS